MPVAVVDGDLLTEQPLDALARGVAGHLDIIVGCNRDEGSFYPPENGGYGTLVLDWHMTGMPEHVRQALRTGFVKRMTWELAGMPAVLNEQPAELRRRIEILMRAYELEWTLLTDRKADEERSFAQWLQDRMATDFGFGAATALIAERLARDGGAKKVFRYEFQGFGGQGGIHAAELELMLGDFSDLRHGSPEVREAWLASWVSFARSGDPNTVAMSSAWRPHSDVGRPALFWDGTDGWRCDGESVLADRRGLFATARLWEELWNLERVSLQPAEAPASFTAWLLELAWMLPRWY